MLQPPPSFKLHTSSYTLVRMCSATVAMQAMCHVAGPQVCEQPVPLQAMVFTLGGQSLETRLGVAVTWRLSDSLLQPVHAWTCVCGGGGGGQGRGLAHQCLVSFPDMQALWLGESGNETTSLASTRHSQHFCLVYVLPLFCTASWSSRWCRTTRQPQLAWPWAIILL